jgi:VCBS repeat-containing protein
VNDFIYAIGGFTPAFGNQISDNALNEQYTPVGYGAIHDKPTPIDDVAPEITPLSPENKTYNTTEIPLTFNINESGSWTRYKLHNSTVAELDGNTTITQLSLNKHSLTVYATDTASNTGATKTVYFSAAGAETSPIVIIVAALGAALAAVGIGIHFDPEAY